MKRKADFAGLPPRTSSEKVARTGDEEYTLNPVPDLPPREEEPACSKKWNVGISRERDEIIKIFMKPSANCRYEIEGQIAYIALPDNKEWRSVYTKLGIKQLTPQEILADKGVFTWLLYRKGDKTLRFVASKVHTPYEIGTIHIAMYEAVGATSAHGAGELLLEGGKVYVNLASGSFVADWVGPKDAPCTKDEMDSYILSHLQMFFPGVHMIKTSSESTYINAKNLPMTLKDLQLYADVGFIICLHPKDQVDTCRKVKSECESPMSASRT